jgi:formate hydrogenlyase subunit 4
MLVSVRRMMQVQLLGSFYMDLAAFALLWLYHALSVAKITKVVKIKSQWFYAHLLVLVVHLLVAVFFNEPSPADVIQSNQVHKEQPSAPVVQPYQVGE